MEALRKYSVLDDKVALAAAAEALAHDGAIVLRDVLGLGWIGRLRTAIDEELHEGSPTGAEFGGAEGRFYGDLFLWLRSDAFREVALDSPLPELAASLMRSQQAHLFYDQLFVKEPGSIEPTPWHQDLPYWPIEGGQVISIWIPVDRATPENGVVTYVRGSHLWGRKFRPQAFGQSGNSDAYDDSPFEPMPDIDAARERYEFLTWSLDPGDVLVHHGMTVHGAPGNRTADARRRAFSIRYTGDDVRYVPRPGTFMDIKAVKANVPAPDLAPGAPMGGRLFPLVWPRAT
jgi:ectoine hydroxylase-related dioxygenase (phytanoyl-CoA dioxygenase family)